MLRLILVTLLLAVGTAGFAQQGALKYTKMTIRGTSTMHDWKSELTNSEGSAKIVKQNGELTAIEEFTVAINVEDIKSDKGSVMDGNTYKALKSKRYPKITISVPKTSSVVKTVSGYKISAVCEVSIAGITRKMTVRASGFDQPNGEIILTGTKTFKMTDFNVKPPVIFMGALKTGDEVTIEFSTVLTE